MEMGIDNLQSRWLRGKDPMRVKYENLLKGQHLQEAAKMLEAMFVFEHSLFLFSLILWRKLCLYFVIILKVLLVRFEFIRCRLKLNTDPNVHKTKKIERKD